MSQSFTHGIKIGILMTLLLMIITLFTASSSLLTPTKTAGEWSPRDYCGIAPAPESIPPIPTLPPEAQSLNLTLTDFYIFTRHGDRSTLTKNCFRKTEFRNRKWTECPNNTVAMHSGLNQRNQYAPTYAFPIHPLPDKQILDGNCHLGQLTQRGLMMSYNNGHRVGKYLAETFVGSQRGDLWTPRTLKLRSTDVHRTRETAEGFITGLLDTMQGDPQTLSKQLPPLYFVDEKVDAQKLNSNVCNTDPYIKEVYESDQWKEYREAEWDPLLREVRIALQDNDATLADVFDCLKPFQCHGLDYPPALIPLSSRIEAAMNKYWEVAYYYQPKRSAQLFSGYLLLELSSLFSTSAMKPLGETPTINLWSGHDFGAISNLATALTFPDFLWPPYSAMINIEFYKAPSTTSNRGVPHTSFVRFLYLGEVVYPEFCKDQFVATQLCPTEVVLNYISSVLPTAEQCPGIPRLSIDFSTIKSSFKNANPQTLADQHLYSTINNLYQTMADLDKDLETVQAQLETQPRPAKTHQEIWAQWA